MSKSVKDAKNFFSTVYAALVVIALAVAFFTYSLIIQTDNPESVLYEVSENGTMSVSPSDTLVPSGPPHVAPPTSPPPLN